MPPLHCKMSSVEVLGVPLFTVVSLPCTLLCCCLCNLLCTIFHLYYRRRCQKGSDVANFLFVLLAFSYQLNNACSAILIIAALTNVTHKDFLTCLIFNVRFLSFMILHICGILLCIAVIWLHVSPVHYSAMRQCVIRRIFSITIVIVFCYINFINIMVCDRDSICPNEIKHSYSSLLLDTSGKHTHMLNNTVNAIACRYISEWVYIPLSLLTVLLSTVAFLFREAWELVKRANPAANDFEMDVSPNSQNNAPLPPFQNSQRLRPVSLLITVYGTVHIAYITILAVSLFEDVFHGNVLSLIMTTCIPMLWMLLEKNILKFGLQLLQGQCNF